MHNFEKPRGYKNLHATEIKPKELSYYQKIYNLFLYYIGYNNTCTEDK
jgi:hypothetical protein